MNTEQTLAALAEFAGNELILIDKFYDKYDENLAYSLNNVGEIEILRLNQLKIKPWGELSTILPIGLKALSLSGSDIDDLSPLNQLKSLQVLDCRQTQVSDLSPLSQVKSLQYLDCRQTPVSDLSPLSQMKSLGWLNCRQTQVSDLSPLSQVKSLQTLDCSQTPVSDLSPLSQMKSLGWLNCRQTQVSDLSPLSQMKSLKELYCSETQVSDLSPLSQMKSLQTLGCNQTQVSDLSPLSQMKSLQVLHCSQTQVSDLSPLSQMKSLQVLHCSQTQVSDLSPLSQVKSLQTLDCSQTPVSDLSPLSQMKSLGWLNCSQTQVSDLSPLTELKKLHHVDVENCQIVNLPKQMNTLNLRLNLEFAPGGIYLSGNPLENPPIEVIKQGNEAVQSYFDSLSGETAPLNEVKVILVGEGAAGKTSVVNRLIDNTFDRDEGMTDGIKISRWSIVTGVETIKANVWDFGGQEIMRATHQLFLSKRCLYLLVLDGRKDERPEHWLKQILSVSAQSHILVVCNKIDENPDDNLQRKHLKQKYPQIVGFFRLSCESAESRQAKAKNKRGHLPMNDTQDKASVHIEVNPTISPVISPTISPEMEQKVDQQQTVSQQVSVNIQIKSLSGELQNWTEDLLDELPKGAESQGVEKEVGRVIQALEEIKSVEEQPQAEEKISKFARVKSFIQDTLEGESKTAKVMQSAGQGVKKLQQIGEQYNKIAGVFWFSIGA